MSDPAPKPAQGELLEALGLALVSVDEPGVATAATGAAVTLVAEPALRDAAVALAAAAPEHGALGRVVEVAERSFAIEARRLAGAGALVSVADVTASVARERALVVAEADAARCLVGAAIRSLVGDAGPPPDVEARIRALARATTTAAPLDDAAPVFDVASLAAAVLERHRPALAGRALVGAAPTSSTRGRGDAATIERALGLAIEHAARRFDPRSAPENRLSVEVGEADGVPFVELAIAGRLLPEDIVAADAALGRALGDATLPVALLGVRALAARAGAALSQRIGHDGWIALRLALQPAAPLATEPSAAPLRARVLAVDDEAMLVAAYQRMMRKSHDVVPAVGGAAALALLEADPEFDLVLCDLAMPQVSGIDLYREVERRWPALARRFVFLSGGAYTEAARAFLDQTGAPCLDKPVDVAMLLEVIAERVG